MEIKPKLSKKEITNKLWFQGVLSWKLDKSQKELYELFYGTDHKVQTWLLARRSGKTFCLCILAIEQCLRQPNSIVKFLAPTKLQLTTILRPLFKQILEDCPDAIKPEFKQKENIYYFPNGSEIQLAGSEGGHAEKLRGGDAHIAIVDEAGSCKDLKNVVNNILLPTTLVVKGKILLASTPPESEDHDFIKYIEDAEKRGSLVRKTVYDNPRLSKEDIDSLIEELGGINSESTRRELFCELIKSSSVSVLPEFTEDLEKQIVKEWPKPPFYDCYVSMDLGGVDLTVVLFAYYDFRANKVIIEDELIFDFSEKENNIEKLTHMIMKKEEELWTNPLTNERKEPYLRVSDINYIATGEILKYSNNLINFIPANKDDNEASINNLRVMLSNKKIIINPKCKTLIRHLKHVKWYSKNNKTKFARSTDNGHYDAVDAIKYLLRAIIYSKNPYPAHWDLSLKKEDTFIANPSNFYSNNQTEVFRKIFNIKRR